MKHEKTVWVLITVCMLASCTASRQPNSGNGILEGAIYSIGNEPFTNICLQASDGTMYLLKCTKEIESDLRTMQGKIVIVHYDNVEKVPEGKALTVVKIEYTHQRTVQ
jgi:hypothetical protein